MKPFAMLTFVIISWVAFESILGASAQVPPLPGVPGLPGGIFNGTLPNGFGVPGLPAPGILTPAAEAVSDATGYNFTKEDIRIFADTNISDIQIDIPGMLFGYGKVDVTVNFDISLEIRVLSVETIYNLISGSGVNMSSTPASNETGNYTGNATENSTENATLWSQVFIPADVFRATFTGELLKMFSSEEEKMISKWVDTTYPNARMMRLVIEWENESALSVVNPLDGSPMEPPITVRASGTLRYIQYMSIPKMIIESGKPTSMEVEKKKTEVAIPPSERGLFGMLAYEFPMLVGAKPGWIINLTVELPPSFSFEYFNHEAVYGDRMNSVSFTADALDATKPVETAYISAITNRGLVIFYLLVVLTVIITLVGLPIRWHQKKKMMRNIDKKISAGLKNSGK
ncbi:MAG: hypothetical protein PHH26_04350 [Candidatus Thermoplasmatota archaeon]|nr:hypothetical protein [Candidatus Thermoplasmatota archaeon]